jgi:hypothetical protein
MAYRAAMPKLLRELGWEIESDEFTEIEDPDPENHEARQRELIREIEDARKEAENKGKAKSKSSWWRRGPKDKKSWETYDAGAAEGGSPTGEKATHDGPVLFDIDAIRRELESEHLEVKQLDSTLPPLQLNLNPSRAEEGAVRVASAGASARTSKTSTPEPKKQARGPSGNGRTGGWDEYDEGDLGSERPALQSTTSESRTSTLQAPARSDRDSPGLGGTADKVDRPELRSARTSPALVGGVAAGAAFGAGAVGLSGYSAWADDGENAAGGGEAKEDDDEEDDDDEFAPRGEATMSFE